MRAEDIHDGFKSVNGVVERLRSTQNAHSERLLRLELQQEAAQKDMHSLRKEISKMCDQLTITDARITSRLDLLFEDLMKREGAKMAVSWFPSILTTVISIFVIIGYIKFGIK